MFAISRSALRWSSEKPNTPAPAGDQAPAMTPGSSTGTISPDSMRTMLDMCAASAARGTASRSSTICPGRRSTAKPRRRPPAQTTTPATRSRSAPTPSRDAMSMTSSASPRKTSTGVPATSCTRRSANASVCSTLSMGSAHSNPSARTTRTWIGLLIGRSLLATSFPWSIGRRSRGCRPYHRGVPNPDLPLAGIRVLDLTQILAGPFCTMVLGDLGADIVKVERPDGDGTRRWGPPFAGDESAYFLQVNRNKRSIAIDLKDPAGAAVAQRLAARVDVVIENFLPGAVERFGLDHETVRAEHQRVVDCAHRGFPTGHSA